MTEQSPRIIQLPDTLIDQIAAGEVIERPASVLKELLENSVDAGATIVDVDIERAGVPLMRVRDDGCGIPRDDLRLALARHCTSKLQSLADLEKLTSLGFRGEALPSIASVSRLTLTSRVGEEEHGWSIGTGGRGRPTAPQPCPHPGGTTVEVRDLFFNTPARRRFLRSEKTEFFYIQDLIHRIALGRFELGVRFSHNRRRVLSLQPAREPAEREARLAAVLGTAFLEGSAAVDAAAGDLRLWGRLGRPEIARSQSDTQFFYLNGRIVRDKRVIHAIRLAYDELLAEGRQPAYVLHLEMPPGQYDVNVHPTKAEVRFRDGRSVHDFIWSTLRAALGQPASSHPADPPRQPSASGSGAVPARVAESWRVYAAPTQTPGARPAARPAAVPEREAGLGSALGTVHERYLVAQNAVGLVLIDLAAAQEALLAARLSEGVAGAGLRSQPLLLPATVKVTEPLAECAERAGDGLLELGLQVDRAGPQVLMIRKVPALLRRAEPGALVVEVLEALAGGGDAGERRERALGRMALLGGSAAPTPSTQEEMNALLRELEALAPSNPAESLAGLCRVLSAGDLAALLERAR